MDRVGLNFNDFEELVSELEKVSLFVKLQVWNSEDEYWMEDVRDIAQYLYECFKKEFEGLDIENMAVTVVIGENKQWFEIEAEGLDNEDPLFSKTVGIPFRVKLEYERNKKS